MIATLTMCSKVTTHSTNAVDTSIQAVFASFIEFAPRYYYIIRLL